MFYKILFYDLYRKKYYEELQEFKYFNFLFLCKDTIIKDAYIIIY